MPRRGYSKPDLSVDQIAANLNKAHRNRTVSITITPRGYKQTTGRFKILRFFVKEVFSGAAAHKIIVVELELLETLIAKGSGKALKVGKNVTIRYKDFAGYI